MKKMMGAIIMALLFTFTAIPVLATSVDGPKHEGDTIFASENVVEEIKANLDEQQVKSFFDEKEVVLDFEHVIPVYMPLNLEDSSTLSESLKFTNEYNVPVTDTQGNNMGMATLQLYKNKWVIGIFVENYDIMVALNNKPATEDGASYFIELNKNSEFGLLNVTKNGEAYIKLEEGSQLKASTQNAADILEQLKQDMANNSSDSEGSGYAVNSNMFPYFAIGVVVILVAAGYTVYILKRRNHSGA